MRITAGEWGSRRLRGPGNVRNVRPTPDAMRERAFAVLGELVSDARFLDLFAGTGAVGLEALSRGATSAVFVEKNRTAAALARTNIGTFDLQPERARLLVRGARSAVAELAASGKVFDIVWADPPFERWRDGLEAVEAAFSSGLIAPAGIGCLECPEKADVETVLAENLEVVRDLHGGASRVVMISLRRGEEPVGDSIHRV